MVLALYVFGLTTNITVGVMARIVAGVSVKVAAKAATRLATIRSGLDCSLFWRLFKRPDHMVQNHWTAVWSQKF